MSGLLNESKYNWSFAQYAEDQNKYDDLINELDDWSSIPKINNVPAESLVSGSLVTYTGMVQDILNPGYFMLKHKTRDSVCIDTAQFRSLSAFGVDEPDNENQSRVFYEERQPLFCVPIPGINSWAKNSVSLNIQPSQVVNRRLSMDENGMEVDSDQQKRTSDNEKKNNYPDGPPCMINVTKQCDVLLCDKIEAIGFYCFNPELNPEDEENVDPPLWPGIHRIHAIKVRKIKHCNPFMSQIMTPIARDGMSDLRSDLHLALTQILFGDALAADYLICSLVASVYIRKECLTLGAISLNLFNIHCGGYGKRLFEFLQKLIPLSSYIPLTIDFLNRETFVPRKNYDTNRLCRGALQLSEETHLLVDETEMGEGRLYDLGCRNMAGLRSIILSQQLSYDFKYYSLNYNTNIPVVVVSEGKSMLPVDIVLKIKPDVDESTVEEVFASASMFLSGSRIERIRNFLCEAKLRECVMNEETAEKVETDWVEMRQNNSRLMQEDLHRHIVLARLLSLSHGFESISTACWSRARDMENEREARSN